MAIAFDAVAIPSAALYTATFSWTHTPVGTPRGVAVIVVQEGSTDQVSGVTYGGVALTRIRTDVRTATEPGRVYIYSLGSGVPTGAQTVQVTLTGTADTNAVSLTVTAASDTAVDAQAGVDAGIIANPSLSISPTVAAVIFYGIFSGLAAPVTTVETGSTHVAGKDYGTDSAMWARKSVASGGATTIGYTAASDDVCHSALAIREGTGLTAVGDIIQQIWDTRQALGDTSQFIYHIRALGSDTIQQIWHIRGAIGDTVQSIWDVRALASKTVQLVHHIRVTIGDTSQYIWNVLVGIPVGDTFQLVWHIKASIGDTVQSIWHTRYALGKPSQYIWHIRAVVSDTVQTVWNVLVPVLDTLQTIWNTRQAVGKTRQFIWNVAEALTAVAKTLQLKWYVGIRRLWVETKVTLSQDLNFTILIAPLRSLTSMIKRGLKIISKIAEK